jgi:hypothetical protein
MTTPKRLEKYLKQLRELGFRHEEKYGDIFREVVRMHDSPEYRAYRNQLALIRDWLLIPYSFWAIDFAGTGRYLCERLKAKLPLPPTFLFMLRLLNLFPSKAAQELVKVNEHSVQRGQYHQFVKADKKFLAFELYTINNETLRIEWEQIKVFFPDYEQYANHNGVIRRTMICERNFKVTEWPFRFLLAKERFQALFDVFAARWSLYGVELRALNGADKPLLLKLTVNITPYGTQVMVPFYMSPDFARDINWSLVTKLHKLMGATRQGDKLVIVTMEREDEDARICLADKQALKDGLRGDKRVLHVMKEARIKRRLNLRQIVRSRERHEQRAEGQRSDGAAELIFPLNNEFTDLMTDIAAERAGLTIGVIPPMQPPLAMPGEPLSLDQVKRAITDLSADKKIELMQWIAAVSS